MNNYKIIDDAYRRIWEMLDTPAFNNLGREEFKDFVRLIDSSTENKNEENH